MNWKHLIWIIPLFLIIGIFIGFRFFSFVTDELDTMVETMDKCSIQTLNYVATENQDCQILISGYMNNCIENITLINDVLKNR